MIERIFVEDIPLNGRSFQTLIMLTQGAVKFLAGCEADSIELRIVLPISESGSSG